MIDENRKSVWYYVCLHNCTLTAKRLKSVRANAQAYQNISPTGNSTHFYSTFEKSFLAETIKHGNAEILGYLFECGANAGEIIGDNRDSLLHLAASYGHEDILNLLFEKGANVHARNIK